MCFLLEKYVVILALVAAIGCGSKRPPAFFSNPLPLLTWLGEFTRPAGTVYPQLNDSSKYGSLSGLAPDQGRKQWIGVIDDRQHTRVAWLTIDFAPGRFEVLPVRMQELRPGAGTESRRVTEADLESIVALPNGTFVVGEEGHVIESRVWQPALLQMTADGVVTNVIEYPKEFQITGDGKTGLRDNQGFEGLAVTPSGRLIAGLEQPLFQDGAVTFDRGAPGRLIEFEPQGVDVPRGAAVALHDFADAAHRRLRRDLHRRRERPGRAARAQRDDADLDGAGVREVEGQAVHRQHGAAVFRRADRR